MTDLTREQIAWNAGRDAAIDLVSEDRFYTDGQCSWSKFMLDKYQDEARDLQAPQFQPAAQNSCEIELKDFGREIENIIDELNAPSDGLNEQRRIGGSFYTERLLKKWQSYAKWGIFASYQPAPPSDVVEKVARAMCASELPEIDMNDLAYKYTLGETRTEKVWESFKESARVAIAAMRELGVKGE